VNYILINISYIFVLISCIKSMDQNPWSKHRITKTPYNLMKRGGTLTNEERKALRGPGAPYTADGVPSVGFGSAGAQPKRNPNWTNKLAFDRWKQKHPKSTAQHGFRQEDLDHDGTDERVVYRGDEIVGVNGWELRPSRAKYDYQSAWATVNPDGSPNGNADIFTARTSQRIAYKHRYEDEGGMKDIVKEFGKIAIKPTFNRITGGKIDRGGGKFIYANAFYKPAVKVLVGNALDQEMAQRFGVALGDGGKGDNVRNQLHRSKIYKQELKRRLHAYMVKVRDGDPETLATIEQTIRATYEVDGDVGLSIVAPPAAVVQEAEGE
jgi:hypothetical protein